MMMKKIVIIFLFFFPLMLFLACQDENDLFRQEMNDQQDNNLVFSGADSRLIDPGEYEIVYCGEPVLVSLVAGRQKLFVGGSLEVGNDADGNLFLVFTPADGWAFSEIQLYAGDEDGIPTTGVAGRGKNNPKFGKFTDTECFDPTVTNESYTFMIPVEELVYEVSGESTVIVAHALIEQMVGDVLDKKSLLADWDVTYEFSGPRFGGGFLYEFVECEEGSSTAASTSGEEVTNGEDPAGEEEETGGETEAIDLTAYALPVITYSLKIKDLNELQEVGNVRFYFEGDYLKVEYSLIPESGWLIKEIHINIGSLEAAFIGNNENLGVGLFTYVEHYLAPFQITQTYSILVEDLSAYYVPPEDLCETFTVHATLVDASDNTIQKSSFVVWNENVDITGSKWYDSFELCLEPITE
jgi:hypothetical protein